MVASPKRTHRRPKVRPTTYIEMFYLPNTYDQRTLRTELPVRSAVLKQGTGGIVLRWVTALEVPLLYVFDFFFGFPGWLRGDHGSREDWFSLFLFMKWQSFAMIDFYYRVPKGNAEDMFGRTIYMSQNFYYRLAIGNF